jgi:hypothetical protein
MAGEVVTECVLHTVVYPSGSKIRYRGLQKFQISKKSENKDQRALNPRSFPKIITEQANFRLFDGSGRGRWSRVLTVTVPHTAADTLKKQRCCRRKIPQRAVWMPAQLERSENEEVVVVATCKLSRPQRPRHFRVGRRTKVPSERHTHCMPLSVPFSLGTREPMPVQVCSD